MEFRSRITTCFLVSVVFALLTTSFLKAVDLLRSPPYLQSPEPVAKYVFDSHGFRMGHALATAAVLEIAVVIALCSRIRSESKMQAIIWLTLTFWAYRIGFWLSGAQGICPCLGSLGSWLNLEPELISALGRSLLAYMLLGSVVSLAWLKAEEAGVSLGGGNLPRKSTVPGS